MIFELRLFLFQLQLLDKNFIGMSFEKIKLRGFPKCP